MFRIWSGPRRSSRASPRTASSGPTSRSKASNFNGEGLLVGSYFPMLGLQPALGRLLGPAERRRPAGERRWSC